MNARTFTFVFYKNGDRTDKINIRQMAMINFKNYGFLINPSGLGFYNQIGNLEIGNRMLPSKVIPKLKPIQCTIVFENYVRYNAFSNNCAWADGKAVLKYNIPNVGVFDRDITFEEITKTEIINGHLECEVTIKPESFWYKKIETRLTLSENTYASYNIDGDSHLPCEIYFLSHNRCNELTYGVNTSDETIYGKLKNLNELEYPMIRYSSEDGNEYIYNQGSAQHQYSSILNSKYVDVTGNYTPFIKIPARKPAMIRFKSDVANTITLEIKKFFISV